MGFAFVFFLFVYITLKLVNIIKLKEQKLYPEGALIIGIFINLWPIIPTGNFFNNWLSIMYFLPIAYYIYEKNSNLNTKIVKTIK